MKQTSTLIGLRLPLVRKSFSALVVTVSLFVSVSGFSQQLELDGLYAGKNIYIQSLGEGEEYCVTSVVVNGIVLTDLPKLTAFEIPLDRQFLTVGDSVHIVIHHLDGCKPKVLNPSGCVFSKKESVDHFSAAEGSLSWSYKNPPAGYKWIVQQYRWNQWENIGTVMAETGKPDYSFQVPGMHSGDNRFRLIGFTNGLQNGYSEELHVAGGNDPVEMTFHKKGHYVVFSTPTFFRIMNEKGQLIKEDSTQSFQVNELPKGIYFVLYDNQSERIRL